MIEETGQLPSSLIHLKKREFRYRCCFLWTSCDSDVLQKRIEMRTEDMIKVKYINVFFCSKTQKQQRMK